MMDCSNSFWAHLLNIWLTFSAKYFFQILLYQCEVNSLAVSGNESIYFLELQAFFDFLLRSK